MVRLLTSGQRAPAGQATRHISRRAGIRAGIAVGSVAAFSLSPALAPVQAFAAQARHNPSSVQYGFEQPVAATLDGAVLYVANKGGNSVTLVNAETGAYIGIFRGGRYHFDGPDALKLVGQDLFVASGAGDTVTEVNAHTGAVVRVMDGTDYGFTYPVAMASDGSRFLFILCADGSLAKVALPSGKYLGEATGGHFGFDSPTAVVDVGDNLFVANSGNSTVSVLSAKNMSLVRVLRNASGKKIFSAPTGMVTEGGDVWVTNQSNRTVTEISAATGATGSVLQIVPDTENYLPSPGAITYGDGHFYVASPPGSSPMVTQIVPTNPAKMPWMMCNTNAAYTFSNPQALVIYGPNLWVVNEGGAGGPAGNSLTEMNASSGALVRVVR